MVEIAVTIELVQPISGDHPAAHFAMRRPTADDDDLPIAGLDLGALLQWLSRLSGWPTERLLALNVADFADAVTCLLILLDQHADTATTALRCDDV